MLKILIKTIAVVLLLVLFFGGLYFLVKRNEQPAEVFDTRTVTVDTVSSICRQVRLLSAMH